ncbi:MAG: ABC transporter ATP-binding protein [Bacteroidales bacterium]|jgi:iron complex transport system ATP-binding protein|nr:ABC transporter ATP-binding protein [Bacteroidales bacterium]
MKSLLNIINLETGFELQKKRKLVLHQSLNFELYEGQFVSILGPNGAGKSTFIRTLLGFRKALSGDVLYENTLLHELAVKELAKKVAVVLTDKIDESFLTVYEIVSTGRYPYTGFSGRLTDEDHSFVSDALNLVGMQDFTNRNFQQLSDGEKQKVLIARAVAQETPIIILDEPVAFIDAPGKVEIMELLKFLSREFKKGIIAATHDLEAALRFSDQLWLLGSEGKVASGKPEELLEKGIINSFFDKDDITLNKEKVIFEKKQKHTP